jgi:group I intron endonuclease
MFMPRKRPATLTPGVYAIENTQTNRVYVGSSKDIPGRLHNHLYMLRLGTHPSASLQADFQQYGEAAFTFRTLENTTQLLGRERHWQEHLQATQPLYNVRSSTRAGATPEQSWWAWRAAFPG